jgi:hypothetical protein
MGRRGRQGARAAGGGGDSAASPARDHMARVRVSDAVWADFRAAAGSRPLSYFLAELVEGEVRRYRRERIESGGVTDRELLAALAEARELHADMEAVVERLERRLDRSGQASPHVYE